MSRYALVPALVVLVAAVASATPPPFPWTSPESYDFDYQADEHAYLDARLEAAAPTGECTGAFPTTTSSTVGSVCAEVGLWEDLNADAFVDAGEWQVVCSPTTFDVELVSSTGSWGSPGVFIVQTGTLVTSGPITLTLASCDPATGHYHATQQVFFPSGNDPAYAITMQTEDVYVTWTPPWGVATDKLADTDLY